MAISNAYQMDSSLTPHKAWFLVFGVPNAKYFGTHDANALMTSK